MLEARLETEEGGAQRDGHLDGEVIPAALEERVRQLFELEHDVAGDLARLLLRLVLEDNLLAVGHALLDGRSHRLLLPLALVLRLDLHLLLHDHARPGAPLDHLLLLGARAARRAARQVALVLAVAADDSPLDGRRLLVANVQVLQRDGQLDVHVAPALVVLLLPAAKEHVKRRPTLLLPLEALTRRRDAREVVEHTPLLVGEDLVRLRDLAELALAARILVRVVLDGHFAVRGLDLTIGRLGLQV
mmetsp:Transcript_30557/g.83751  ORF Transcript_30557/g.83751 Transcript_30557/m.83751 type:complete len:246 (+) Transcript_30557:495-1232(+)